MTDLRTEMTGFLTDWRDDVHASWRTVLEDVEPDLSVIGDTLTLDDGETIFPGRKGEPAAGARPDSHVFRAFDGLRPKDVLLLRLPATRSDEAFQRVALGVHAAA